MVCFFYNSFFLKFSYFFVNWLNFLVWEFLKIIFWFYLSWMSKGVFAPLIFCRISLLEVNFFHSLMLHFTLSIWKLFISRWRKVLKDGSICQYWFTSDFTFFRISVIDVWTSVVHFVSSCPCTKNVCLFGCCCCCYMCNLNVCTDSNFNYGSFLYNPWWGVSWAYTYLLLCLCFSWCLHQKDTLNTQILIHTYVHTDYSKKFLFLLTS